MGVNKKKSNAILIQFTKRELSLVSSLLTEVLHGYSLDNNEKKILQNLEFGVFFEKKIDQISVDKKEYYILELSLDEIRFICGSIIVVMIELNKHNLYFTHMGFHLSDCIDLLNRIIEIQFTN